MNVDYAHAVKKRDHHEFLGGLALSGLLGSGRFSMLPLGTLSLGLWVITIDPAFIAGYQGIKNLGSELMSSTISLLSLQRLSL